MELGRNGAGKSTLFEIITDIIKPQRGRVVFNEGQNFRSVNAEVGVLWDDLSIFPLLRVREVLNYVAAMYGMKRCPPHLIDAMGLRSVLNTFVGKLSRGESRKLGILLCVMHSPSLLILDEPTSALDPVVRNAVWTDIFKTRERSILLATQQWEEAMSYADRVVFISKGCLLCPPQAPQRIIADSNIVCKVIVGNEVEIEGLSVVSFASDANRTILLMRGQENLLEQIARRTNKYSVFTPSLEDVYQLFTLS